MKAIELEMTINKDGTIHIPDKYHRIFGQKARLVILLPDAPATGLRPFDPMKYSNTLAWPVDGMTYQQQCREEWQ